MELQAEFRAKMHNFYRHGFFRRTKTTRHAAEAVQDDQIFSAGAEEGRGTHAWRLFASSSRARGVRSSGAVAGRGAGSKSIGAAPRRVRPPGVEPVALRIKSQSTWSSDMDASDAGWVEGVGSGRALISCSVVATRASDAGEIPVIGL